MATTISPASLCSLPAVVIRLILGNLKPYPSPPKLGFLPVLMPSEQRKQKALLSLALTSRLLYAHAIPFLYSAVVPFGYLVLPGLNSFDKIPKLFDSFLASPVAANYTYIRHLQLCLDEYSHEPDEQVLLIQILAACTSTVENLAIICGYQVADSAYTKVRELLVCCSRLKHLVIAAPFWRHGEAPEMMEILEGLLVWEHTLQSLQLSHLPSVPLASEDPAPAPRLSVSSVYIDEYSVYTRQYLALLCKPAAVSLLSIKSICDLEGRRPVQGLDTIWENLKELYLHQDSWAVLGDRCNLEEEAVRFLPAFETLKCGIADIHSAYDLTILLMSLPGNTVHWHIEEVQAAHLKLLAKELLSKPSALPSLKSIHVELDVDSITSKKKYDQLHEGLVAFRAVCNTRSLETNRLEIAAAVCCAYMNVHC